MAISFLLITPGEANAWYPSSGVSYLVSGNSYISGSSSSAYGVARSGGSTTANPSPTIPTPEPTPEPQPEPPAEEVAQRSSSSISYGSYGRASSGSGTSQTRPAPTPQPGPTPPAPPEPEPTPEPPAEEEPEQRSPSTISYSSYGRATSSGHTSPTPSPTPPPSPSPSPSPTPPPSPDPEPEPEPEPDPEPIDDTGLNEQEQRILELVNQERIERGLDPLQADPRLTRLARMKSQDMIDHNYFAHESPTYGSPGEMIRDDGVDYRMASENLGRGGNIVTIFQSFMASHGHRNNIINERWEYTGVGVVYERGRGYLVTQLFIQPR